MATKSKEVSDDRSPVAEAIEQALANVSVTTVPVVITGVNRKVNIGNYENIDVYAGVALPVTADEMSETLIQRIEELVEAGVRITSQETFKRYSSIKELVAGSPSE